METRIENSFLWFWLILLYYKIDYPPYIRICVIDSYFSPPKINNKSNNSNIFVQKHSDKYKKTLFIPILVFTSTWHRWVAAFDSRCSAVDRLVTAIDSRCSAVDRWVTASSSTCSALPRWVTASSSRCSASPRCVTASSGRSSAVYRQVVALSGTCSAMRRWVTAILRKLESLHGTYRTKHSYGC